MNKIDKAIYFMELLKNAHFNVEEEIALNEKMRAERMAADDADSAARYVVRNVVCKQLLKILEDVAADYSDKTF